MPVATCPTLSETLSRLFWLSASLLAASATAAIKLPFWAPRTLRSMRREVPPGIDPRSHVTAPPPAEQVPAVGMAELGFSVVGVVVDADKFAALARGEAPFYEPGLDELLLWRSLLGLPPLTRRQCL